MPRVGNNPNRGRKAEQLKNVVLAVVTHLPNFTGYHQRRFEVIELCLKSMTENVNTDYSLIVWDNGSCLGFREFLQDELKPDILVQSGNLGKTGGRTALARIIPPGRIICYSDDDMYFYPGWLAPQLELLHHFPNVACVTGYPVRTAFRWGNEHTKAWANLHADKVELGQFIPREWEDDFAASIGRDPKAHEETTRADLDVLIEYRGKQAYATSHHCQFIAHSEILSRVLSWDGWAMGDEKPFDVLMDNLGLRLATTGRHTRHIGNVLGDEFKSLERRMPMEMAYA